jgi:hypothetical protein
MKARKCATSVRSHPQVRKAAHKVTAHFHCTQQDVMHKFWAKCSIPYSHENSNNLQTQKVPQNFVEIYFNEK